MVRRLGPLEPARAAEIVAGVGAALDAMHRAGTCTATSSRANVLIAGGGHVYLTDFGLARRVASGSARPAPGTGPARVDYAAPEQIRGGHTDARTDVYALGCLLHFGLTGRPPFTRENLEARLWAHLHEPPPAPSALRPGLPPRAGRARRPRARQGPRRPLRLRRRPRARGADGGRRARPARRGVVEPAAGSPQLRLAGASHAEASTVSRAQPAPARLVRPEAAPLIAAAVAVTPAPAVADRRASPPTRGPPPAVTARSSHACPLPPHGRHGRARLRGRAHHRPRSRRDLRRPARSALDALPQLVARGAAGAVPRLARRARARRSGSTSRWARSSASSPLRTSRPWTASTRSPAATGCRSTPCSPGCRSGWPTALPAPRSWRCPSARRVPTPRRSGRGWSRRSSGARRP